MVTFSQFQNASLDISQHEVRSKISLMPEDAPGGNTDTGPDI